MKTRPNPYSNPSAYKFNDNKTTCLISNKEILTDKLHADQYYCKKSRIFLRIETP